MRFLHIDVSARINEQARSWSDPQGAESISFSVPVELFDSKKIANIFPQLIKVAEGKFELAKAEAELDEEEEDES